MADANDATGRYWDATERYRTPRDATDATLTNALLNGGTDADATD